MEINKRTKLILSAIGVSAVVVPALLLIFLTRKEVAPAPEATNTDRTIDTKALEETVKKKMPSPLPTSIPSPISTASATVIPSATSSAN